MVMMDIDEEISSDLCSLMLDVCTPSKPSGERYFRRQRNTSEWHLGLICVRSAVENVLRHGVSVGHVEKKKCRCLSSQ